MVLPTHIVFFQRECVWTSPGANVRCLSSSSVFPCYRKSENNPIFSSKWPEKPKGRSLSVAKYKQAGSLSVGTAGTEWPDPFLVLSVTHLVSVCLCMRFYPSSPFHLRVLSFHANCYSVFHFCDMSVRYLSLFELAVVPHY